MLSTHVGAIVTTEDACDIPNNASADELYGVAGAIIGVALIAHLRDELVLFL